MAGSRGHVLLERLQRWAAQHGAGERELRVMARTVEDLADPVVKHAAAGVRADVRHRLDHGGRRPDHQDLVARSVDPHRAADHRQRRVQRIVEIDAQVGAAHRGPRRRRCIGRRFAVALAADEHGRGGHGEALQDRSTRAAGEGSQSSRGSDDLSMVTQGWGRFAAHDDCVERSQAERARYFGDRDFDATGDAGKGRRGGSG